MSTVRRSRRSSAKVDSRGLAEVAKKLSPPESKQAEQFAVSEKSMDSSSDVQVQSPECEKGVWSQCEELCQRLPGRRSQVEMLLTLFGEVRNFGY